MQKFPELTVILKPTLFAWKWERKRLRRDGKLKSKGDVSSLIIRRTQKGSQQELLCEKLLWKRVLKRETNKGKGHICPVCRIEQGIKLSLVVDLSGVIKKKKSQLYSDACNSINRHFLRWLIWNILSFQRRKKLALVSGIFVYLVHVHSGPQSADADISPVLCSPRLRNVIDSHLTGLRHQTSRRCREKPTQ